MRASKKIPGFRYVGDVEMFEPAFVTEDGRVRIHQASPRKWAVYGAGGTRFYKEVRSRDAAIQEAQRLASESAAEDVRLLENAKKLLPSQHHATKKKKPAQLQREIDEVLSRRSARRRHHATRKPGADAWDVAMDALLENDPAKAARIVASIRKEHNVPSYQAITMDATPEFTRALEESPAAVQDRFFKSLDLRTSKFYERTAAADVLMARRNRQPIRHAFVGDATATITFDDGSTSTGHLSNRHVQELLNRAKREGAEIET